MFIKYKVQFMHDGRTICWEDWDSDWDEHKKLGKLPNLIPLLGSHDSDFTKEELEAYDLYGLITDRIVIWNANASKKDSWHRVKELRTKGKFQEIERLQKKIKSLLHNYSSREEFDNFYYEQKIVERQVMHMIDDAIYDYERGKGASAERRKKDSELAKPITDVSDTVLNELNDMASDMDSSLDRIYSIDFQKMEDFAEKSFKVGEISEREFLKIRSQIRYASGKISPMREELEKAQKMMQTELDAIREKILT